MSHNDDHKDGDSEKDKVRDSEDIQSLASDEMLNQATEQVNFVPRMAEPVQNKEGMSFNMDHQFKQRQIFEHEQEYNLPDEAIRLKIHSGTSTTTCIQKNKKSSRSKSKKSSLSRNYKK